MVPSVEVLTQEMDRNVFFYHQQELDVDQKLLFVHRHEILRFSVNDLQPNSLVNLSVLSASVFLKTILICACSHVDVFIEAYNQGC